MTRPKGSVVGSRYSASAIEAGSKRVTLICLLAKGAPVRGSLIARGRWLVWQLALSRVQTKSAVLNSLTSKSGQRTYDHAINEFVDWYCSEPRLAFNRTVVLHYRIHLEQRHLAPTTINLRLAAVRRVAYEAADSGLLSPELAAGIRRVKGVRSISQDRSGAMA